MCIRRYSDRLCSEKKLQFNATKNVWWIDIHIIKVIKGSKYSLIDGWISENLFDKDKEMHEIGEILVIKVSLLYHYFIQASWSSLVQVFF